MKKILLSKQDFWLILPVGVIKLVYLVSYPLNISGDGFNYYTNMILPGRAMLVHAGGYSFLWGMLLHNFKAFAQNSPALFEYMFVFSQHAFDLFCLVLMYRTILEIFGRFVAAVSFYFCGLSIFYLTIVSMTVPDWLQPDLWILFLYCIFKIWQGQARRHVYFASSIFLLEISYLVKFNSIILMFFYGALLLGYEFRRELFSYIKPALLGGAAALLFHLVYLHGYHYPTTGTYDLHYDSGWVLVETYNPLIEPENGIQSARFFALNGKLPEMYNYEKYFNYLFQHVDAVPPESRQPYLEFYQRVLTADQKRLDRMISKFPPWPTDNYVSYVLRIQYYIGLKTGNDLGVETAMEAIKAKPIDFIRLIWKRFIAVNPGQWRANTLPYKAFLDSQGVFLRGSPNKFMYYQIPYKDWIQVFRTNQLESRFWMPGLSILNAINVSMAWPSCIVIGLAALFSAYKLVYKKDHQDRIIIFIILLLFILVFKLASAGVAGFRWKELRAVYPIIGICFAFGVQHFIEQGTRFVKEVMFKTKLGSA